MTSDKSCDERHELISAFIRYLAIGLIAAFTAVFSQYLYAAATYAEKAEVEDMKRNVRDMRRELREDIKAGFERIEDQISKP